MVFVCSFPVQVSEIEKYFQYLGEAENRHYYASRNYLEEFFSVNKEAGGIDIFLKELAVGQLAIEDSLAAWLGISKHAIVHMTVEEMDTFVDLVEMSGDEDVFLNLMEKPEGEAMSVGQSIFLNSLIEIVRRFRHGK